MEYDAIKEKVAELGADAARFLNLADYGSLRSPDPGEYLPGAESPLVFILRELRGSYERGRWWDWPPPSRIPAGRARAIRCGI